MAKVFQFPSPNRISADDAVEIARESRRCRERIMEITRPMEAIGPGDPLVMARVDGYPVYCQQIRQEDGSWFFLVHLPDFGRWVCSATGDTVAEALEALRSVKDEVVRHFNNVGKVVPPPSSLYTPPRR